MHFILNLMIKGILTFQDSYISHKSILVLAQKFEIVYSVCHLLLNVLCIWGVYPIQKGSWTGAFLGFSHFSARTHEPHSTKTQVMVALLGLGYERFVIEGIVCWYLMLGDGGLIHLVQVSH